jgi:hypothetical protein
MERKNVYAKFILKEKENGGFNEDIIEKRIKQFTILVEEIYAKMTLNKE